MPLINKKNPQTSKTMPGITVTDSLNQDGIYTTDMKLRAFPSSCFVQRPASTLCTLAGLWDFQAEGRSKNKRWPMAFTFPSLYFSKWNKYTLIPSSKFSGMCCREVYESISDAKTHDWANTRKAFRYKQQEKVYWLFCSIWSKTIIFLHTLLKCMFSQTKYDQLVLALYLLKEKICSPASFPSNLSFQASNKSWVKKSLCSSAVTTKILFFKTIAALRLIYYSALHTLTIE